jgi:ribose-phosphate pyrophosphokinase
MRPTTVMVAPGGATFGEALCERTAIPRGDPVIGRFPDGEVHVRLERPVRGETIIILQSTAPPVHERLFELFALADACRRDGAARIVAVVPYFGYARADAREGRREPLMSRLVAELVETAGIDELVTLDAHRPQLEGCFHIPLTDLSAAPLLAAAIAEDVRDDTVVVSPDLGGARLARAYADALGVKTVILDKHRENGERVRTRDAIGDVADRRCLITDDMVTTGGTVIEAIRALSDAGARPPMVVAATHGLLVGDAAPRLEAAGVSRMVTTDSVVVDHERPPWVDTVSLAPLLVEVVETITSGGSVTDLS